MASLGELIVNVGARIDGFRDAMGEVDSSLGNLENRGVEFAEKFAEAFTFAEITKSVFEAGETFENAMSKIERATGAVGEPLHGLEESFAHTFGNVVQGADDVAGGLALLSQRTGATGEDLNSLVDINSKLAQVLGQDLKPIVQETQKVFAAFKTEIAEQPAKLDALLAISQKSGVSFNTLTSGLQTMGPTLRAMGLDITDSAALLANFEEQGISTGKVAGTLNATLVSLAKEGFVDPKAALGEFLKEIINAKDPTEALQLASENFKGKGLIPLVDALQNGAGNLATLRDAADNSKGKIEETASSTEKLTEKFKLLEGATTKLLAPIGVELVAALGHMVDAGTSVVKWIDIVVAKADELDKKFGTDADHFSAYIEGLDAMGKVLAEKVIPGLKDSSDAAAANKLLDGSMKDGAKTLSDLLRNVASHAGDAKARFEELDKELKEAEKNLSDIEAAVRMGIGTDEDAAAAKLKVVAAMQALHPELQSIFAETSAWDNVLLSSNVLLPQNTYEVAQLNDELLKLAPTISASTALLMSQAVSLQARAGLWATDIQDIQDQGAALAESSDALGGNLANYKGFDEVLKLVNTGLKDEWKAIQQVTGPDGFGTLHEAHMLGIEDLTKFAGKIKEDQVALQDLVDKGLVKTRQEMETQAGILQKQIRLHTELGDNTDKLKIQLIALGDQLRVVDGFWLGLDKTLHQVSANLVNDIGRGMGQLVFSLFDNSANDALDKQMDSLRSKLTETSSAYDQTIADLQTKMQDLTTTNASELAKQLADLDSSLTDATAAHQKATEDIKSQMDDVTQANADSLRKQLADLQDTVNEKRLQYSQDVQNIKDSYAKTTENIKDSAAQKELDYKHWVETQQLALKRLEGDNSASAVKQREDIQLQLKQRGEDMDLYRSQEKEHLADAENDLQTSLKNRADDYALAMQELNRKQAQATVDAKTQLDKQLADLQGKLDDSDAKYEQFKVDTVQKQKDITDAAATELAKQKADVQKQLDDATAAFEKYKTDNAAQLQALQDQHKSALDKVSDMFSGVFKKAGEDLVAFVTEFLIGKLFKQLDLLVDKTLPGVADSFKNTFSGISIPGLGGGDPGGLPGVGDAPGIDLAGAGGGAGGIGGSILSAGLSSTLGLVAAGISAATGVVSIFQNMHQETSLNAIESNTRVGALYTLAVLQEAQGARQWNWDHLLPALKDIVTWEGYIVSAITNDLPAKLTTSISGSFSSALKDAWLNVIGIPDIKNGISDMVDFNWKQLAPDMGSFQTKLDAINYSIVTSKGGAVGNSTPAPVFKIYLDGRELLQSVVTQLSQSGTVAPAT